MAWKTDSKGQNIGRETSEEAVVIKSTGWTCEQGVDMMDP